jgi:hypothetical protein
MNICIFIYIHTCKIKRFIPISRHLPLLDAWLYGSTICIHLLFVSFSSKDLFAEVRRVLHHEAENCSPKELTQITWATRTSSAQIALTECGGGSKHVQKDGGCIFVVNSCIMIIVLLCLCYCHNWLCFTIITTINLHVVILGSWTIPSGKLT